MMSGLERRTAVEEARARARLSSSRRSLFLFRGVSSQQSITDTMSLCRSTPSLRSVSRCFLIE